MLGHVVSREGISTDPEKIRVIKEWPEPVDESQLRAFLGTAGYYRQFVPNYAQIASLCTALVKRGTVSDGQLSVRKLSRTSSTNCRVLPSWLFPS